MRHVQESSLGRDINASIRKLPLEGRHKHLVLIGMGGEDDVAYRAIQLLQKV